MSYPRSLSSTHLMRIVRALIVCAGLCLSLPSFAACSLRITSVVPCLQNGTPGTPHVGDAVYGILIKWTVTGTPTKPYSVRIDLGPYTYMGTATTQPGNWTWHVNWGMPTDGTISYRVQLDPTNVSGDPSTAMHIVQSNFVPIPPTSATVLYGSQSLKADQTATVGIGTAPHLTKVEVLLGKPTNGVGEQILSYTSPTGAATLSLMPNNSPAVQVTLTNPPAGTSTIHQSFTLRASNFMANQAKVDCSWSDLRKIAPQFKTDLASDTLCQANDPSVVAFVHSVLPSNYQTTLTPLAAARKLFQAVAARIKYKTPAPIDAVTVLKTGIGDCGGYSSLYIACLRYIGIPAHPVGGWVMNDWHCWSELYTPTGGWIPQDVTACYSACQGRYAFYFMVMPDLNARCEVGRGSQFFWSGFDITNMEGGGYTYWGSGSVAYSVTHSLVRTGP